MTALPDLRVAGAGIVGLAVAVAVKQALGAPFRVEVADPALARPPGDPRASAVIPAARLFLEALGVWDPIAGQAQPILRMDITDSRGADVVRPVLLAFDAPHDDTPSGEADEAGGALAHMIDNAPLAAALRTQAERLGVALNASAVDTLDGARLTVAADGARSALRRLAGISTHGWDYPQAAIVTTVAHEREHHGRAVEHFLPSGPFAILPMTGRRSSIVWTEPREDAQRLAALDDDAFRAELERRFGYQLGDLALAGPRAVHPLEFFVARSFIGERLALAGDAAHVVHPIAGQGLNMGLKDAAALAECVTDAARLGLDPGGAVTLERYQRWRRFDTMTMAAATDGLNRLFSNDSAALRFARDTGLGIVQRLPALKEFFAREAAGVTGDVPKLMRGEAL